VPNLPNVVVAVIVLNQSTILLGKSAATGKWTLPAQTIAPFQSQADAGVQGVLASTGVNVEVTASLFVSENINPPSAHDIVVVALGKPLGDLPTNDSFITTNLTIFSQVRWVDFRELGDIQNDVDDVTADAIMKFGMFLQSKSAGNQVRGRAN